MCIQFLPGLTEAINDLSDQSRIYTGMREIIRMDENRGNNQGGNNKGRKNGQNMLWFVLATVVVLLLVTMITNGIGSLTNQEITYSEFQTMVKEHKVKSVVITNSQIDIEPVEDKKSLYQVTYYTVNLKDDRMYELLDEYGVDYTGKNNTTSAWVYQILSFVIPVALVWILLGFAMRKMGGGGGVMGVGKSNAKMYVEKSTGVTFRDVAGQDEAKESLQEVVDFLHNPQKYTAIVTGASSGIGRAISEKLGVLGYEVFGIGRRFDTEEDRDIAGVLQCENDLKNAIFHPIICDLTDTDKLCAIVKQVTSEHTVKVLVNNAGAAYYGLHEELNPKKIQEMVRVNLEAPLILTQQLLRTLKKNGGYIINISSVTAKQPSPHGCAYAATKAGLASFSSSLFDEARKYGVKVTAVYPDMTETNLYRNADFTVGEEKESYLTPEEVAEAVEYVLTQREGIVIPELVLRPQFHRIRKKK